MKYISKIRENLISKILFLSIILLNLLVYGKSLNYFFAGDDFFYLYESTSLIKAVSIKPYAGHYNPVFLLVFFFIQKLFSLNPFYFHLTSLLVHIVTVSLVFFLANIFLKNKWYSILVALLFSIFYMHFEVVFWISGLNTSLMTFFSIITLINFIRFIECKRIMYYLIFLASLILTFLSHEYGLYVLPVCFLYWFFFTNSSSRKKIEIIKQGLLTFIPPLTVIFAFIAAKLTFIKVAQTMAYPQLLRIAFSIGISFLYLFSPNPIWLKSIIHNVEQLTLNIFPFKGTIELSILLLIFVAIKLTSRNDKLNLFLLSWIFTIIVLFSVTSFPQARYFYSVSIPSSILIVNLLFPFVKFAKKLNFNSIYSLTIILFLLSVWVNFLLQQQKTWSWASRISMNVLKDTNYLLTKNKDLIKKDIIFINLPISVPPAWPWFKAYTLGSLQTTFKLFYGKDLNIKTYFVKDSDSTTTMGEFITADDFNKLKSDVNKFILIFNPKKNTIEPI